MLNWAKCGVFLTSILAVQAGEPIKFSPGGDKVALPDKNTKENKFDGPIKGESGESVGDYQLPTSMPTAPSSSVLFNNKKLQELIDQRKNWIYMTPEMSMESANPRFEKDKTSNETAPGLFDKGGKSKKVVERYMENQDRQNIQRNQSNADRLEDELNGKGVNGGKASKGSELFSAESGFNKPLMQMPEGASPSLVRGLGRLEFSGKSAGYQDYSSQLRSDSDVRFQQLLHPSTDKTPVNGSANDPMRLLSDGTSKELQPVTGKSLEVLAGEKINSSGDIFGDPNQGAFPRNFGSVNGVIGGSSSLSPAIIAPSATVQLMSQPVVLPLPKRKF